MTVNKNSMLYWYPKIRGLRIPQPRTAFIEVDPNTAYDFIDDKDAYDFNEIKEAADLIGFPLFMRTDYLSAKHDWNKTCFVKSKDDLKGNVARLVDASLSADVIGIDVNAFIFREYIEMDSKFTAFWGEMPVCPERRYFVKHGKVLCHHPYWVEDSIRNPSVDNWKELLEQMNREEELEIVILSKYASMIGGIMGGYWSIDFCRAKHALAYDLQKSIGWVFIDMALGQHSWHPEDCKQNLIRKKVL